MTTPQPHYIMNDVFAICRLPDNKGADEVAIKHYFASAETWKAIDQHKSMDNARLLLHYGFPCRQAEWLVYGAIMRVFTDGEFDVVKLADNWKGPNR